MIDQAIHTPDDGRAPRQVFLDGKEVRRCVYADESKGFVRFYDDPPRIDKRGKRIITRTKRGVVVVREIERPST